MKKSGAVIPTAEYEVLYDVQYSVEIVIRSGGILFHTTIKRRTRKIAKNLSSSDSWSGPSCCLPVAVFPMTTFAYCN